MKINQYHRAVLQDYSNGDHAYLGELEVVDIEEIHAVGDGLLTFLMLELSDEEGCENPEEALRRTSRARDDLDAAFAALTALQEAHVEKMGAS